MTSKNLNLKGIQRTLDTYFPEYDGGGEHSMLFIRAVKDEELPEIATRRVEVENYMEARA